MRNVKQGKVMGEREYRQRACGPNRGHAMDLSPQRDAKLLKGIYPVPLVGRWVDGCDMIQGCSKITLLSECGAD